MLDTQRLEIREFRPDDFDDFALLVADPEVMRFSLKGPLGREEAVGYFQNRIMGHYQKHGFGLWALILKEEKKLIGFAGLITQEIEGKEKIELAYRLLPTYWGRGLASEAATAISEYAFGTLHLKDLISIIDTGNHRSLLLAKRLGMDSLKKTDFHGHDVYIYARSNPHHR
jgi:ribosomal-protein-alanine N-acetyltransferase